MPLVFGEMYSKFFEQVVPMNEKSADEHLFIAELLPWYANGTLEPSERAEMDKHLTECADCRFELEQYQQVSASITASTEDDWQPSSAHFAQILHTIDAEETAVSANPILKKPSHRPSFWEWLQAQAKAMAWLLAVETAVLAAVVLMLVIPHFGQQAAVEPLFQTFSKASSPSITGQARLHIVFAEDISEREIRLLLTSVQGHLVDGPSPLGVYTVALASDIKPDFAIALFRKHPQVRLAEPVAGTIKP